MKTLKPLLILLMASAFYSCSTVPLTGRRQLSLVSDTEINQAAASSYSQLLSSPQTKVIAGTTEAQRVKRIGGQLATVIERYLQQNGYANQYECSKRGVYSGAIGYFSPDDDFDFNVVIRTLLYNQSGKYLSFHVGSAITYHADAEKEYEECLLKAKAIMEVLGQ